uniref:Uncharacterized protein n=1 Tax=Arundo donax TaxID=35708 RepID=A0A0A9H540_ARUDO
MFHMHKHKGIKPWIRLKRRIFVFKLLVCDLHQNSVSMRVNTKISKKKIGAYQASEPCAPLGDV